MRKIISVASGKGGVGKSTVVAGLCAALCQMGVSVLALDCDAGMRNLDLLLGLEGSGIYNMSDALKSGSDPRAFLTKHPDYPNLDFLPASNEFDDPLITAENMMKLINSLGEHDFVIIDLGSGIGRIHREIAKISSSVLLVTTPEFTSIRDADKAARALSAPKKLVINRVNPVLITSGKFSNIDEIIDATSVQLIGIIPDDPKVTVLNNAGIPVTPDNSKAGTAVENIAYRLCGERRPLYKFW